ncbi:hypothetical protein EG329_000335 [Mollisiaceae sp. DMI_Dod_QoI]|nr:hypothetical protein EG329_000335 [Helotiales sp. DMI_Dod_QoI]
MSTMNSLESSAAVAENMRTTASKLGGRALSVLSRRPDYLADPVSRSNAARPRISHSQLKTWHPNDGIVFRTISNTPRSPSVAATLELQQDYLLHSNAEDNYVTASADLPALGSEPNDTIQVVVGEEPKKTARQIADELHELALNDPEQDELPKTCTSYKMPEEQFRAAKAAVPGSIESYWSHTLYRSPPDAEGKTRRPLVHYCRTIFTTEKVIKDHFADKKVIGFDIEWAPEAHKLSKARKNVSLVQIACEDRIALFHLALYPRNAKGSENSLGDLVAPSLKKIMEDPNVTKVGVAIRADCTRLKKYLDITTQGMFELSHLHKLVKFSKSKDFSLINRSLVSLARQVQEHLHLPLFKGDEVRQTDWSEKLNMAQIMYAASDSYAGLQLYYTLELKRKALDPVPPRPFHAESNKPIRIAEDIEIPPEEDEPTIRSVDAKVIIRTKKYNKKAGAEAPKDSEVEDFSPAADPPHSFFTRSSTEPPLATMKKPGVLQKAEASTSRFIKSKGKLGDVSHLPLSPTHLSRRSIKTYHLWLDNPSLGLDAIGAMLRSPPLSVRSVAKMILEAIKSNGIPYEKRRLREVLRLYAMTAGGKYIEQHPYFELARDSGYNELIGEAEKKE